MMSASTGYSFASCSPIFTRASYTSRSSRTLSGRAKYTHSNMQCAVWFGCGSRIDSKPSGRSSTISPGFRSRMNFNPSASTTTLSDAKGPDRVRIPDRVHGIVDHEGEAVRPDETAGKLLQRAMDVAPGVDDLVRQQTDDHFAVRRRHERPALLAELLPDFVRVRDVPVMRERDVPVRRLHDDRLRVLEHARAGGGVAHVADARIPADLHQVLAGEDLMDQPHAPLRLQAPVVDGEARGLLAAVLEDPQAVVQVGRHGRRGGAADDPALLRGAKVGVFRRPFLAGHPQCLFAQEKFRSFFVRP